MTGDAEPPIPEPAGDIIFEPSPEKILENIVPYYVHFELFQMLLRTRASEHSARMVAMKSATDNAKEHRQRPHPRIQQGPSGDHHKGASRDFHRATCARLTNHHIMSNKGKIVQVIGPVVDVEFNPEEGFAQDI